MAQDGANFDPDQPAPAAGGAAFNAESWMRDLLALNPWAKPYIEAEERLRAIGHWEVDEWADPQNAETEKVLDGFAQAQL